MDVKALYPSIQPELALQAVREVLSRDKTVKKETKKAIAQFVELSFENSYVVYNDECYKSKLGIPTGGSLSRQIADIFLHWILFHKMTPKLSTIQMIRFWKRFIDDVVGVWRGTKRSFYNFVKQLNAETMKYGIEFPISEVQFGKSVHVLDLTASLDQDNTIQYQGYSKPTDSKRYLHPNSFHPQSIFNAIPYSQMLRTLRNNSKPELATKELDTCLENFANSGYEKKRLDVMKQRAINSTNSPATINEESDTLVFPVHHFDGIKEFKGVLRSLENELK